MNKQPWRVVESGSFYHFFSKVSGDRIKIDLGIAICHFVKALEAFNIDYQLVMTNSQLLTNYIVTVRIENSDDDR